MFTQDSRPVTVAVHPKLIDEIKFRKEFIESKTGRKAKGGLTTFSETAAMELKAIRESGDKIMGHINKTFKLKNSFIKRFSSNGINEDYVPFEIFKKIYILCSVLSRKKDQTPIQLEITKIRGLNKNEIICLWKDE